MFGKRYKIKSGFIFLFFFGMMLFLSYRLFSIQVLGYTRYSDKARKLHRREIPLLQKRGDICDRNGNILAMNIKTPSVYADPRFIKDADTTVNQLSQIFKIDKKVLSERLTEDKKFVWIKRRITQEEKEKISALKLQGIGFEEEPTRTYPKGRIAVHVLGSVNIDNEGIEGVELICDKYLKGKQGLRVTEIDNNKREVLSLRDKEILPEDGYNIVLTIDEVMQYIIEEELDKAMEVYHPRAATAIIMEPDTGEILALANRPNYNPNKYNEADADSMRNRAVTDCFEPGSVFKMYVAGAALEEKLFGLKDTIFCENGTYPVPGGALHDHHPYGNLTFQQVIEKSSNIGMAKVGQRLGQERVYKYVSSFGFGRPTGVLLPGEVGGVVHPTQRWTAMSITRIPMGHEVSVTAIQLVAATSAIANGGRLMKPLIVKRIMDNRDRVITEFTPIVVKEVIKKESSDRLKTALQGVVSPKGTAVRAKLDVYSAGGKTGTAQKRNPDGTYSHEFFMSSFVGFAPVESPRVVIAVILDAPRPIYYGGVTAAPVFKNIAEKVLSYLNVEPEIGNVETLITSQKPVQVTAPHAAASAGAH